MIPFTDLPKANFGVIYADPPWHFKRYSENAAAESRSKGRARQDHYPTMTVDEMMVLPVADVCLADAVLLMWTTWPHLAQAMALIAAWGFQYKTAGFDWLKADVSTIDLFPDPKQADMKMGYWTRSNGEPCLLATRGKPKRLHADVRMGIIERSREHSRKPDCVYPRIERLVAGPYLEMFCRTSRAGWTSWGNQVGKFAQVTE